MLRTLLFFLSLAICLPTQAATLKIATLLPDGTSWMKAMRAGAKEIEQRTAGRLKLRIYPGGVMGNDKSVLRKIRIGQLHGGVLSTSSFADIYGDIQVYSLPFLFRNFEEVDYVRKRMDPLLIDGLSKAGYVSFGLSEGGFVYLMSQYPINRVNDLRKRKVWAPEGDKISLISFKSMGVTPIQLPITDVLTGLQTGLIDTIGASPVAAIALQWHTRIKYVTDQPILYLYGTLVITKKSLARLSRSDRSILNEVLTETFQQINRDTRKDNGGARAALASQGIKFVHPTPEDMENWRSHVRGAIEKINQQDTYSEVMMNQLQKHLSDFRGR
ncbi:MAG: C4-dicarboxylate ABC transporter [Gammaproteobacteria bacterium]|nr:C4-dicarboxylate ABC transporter [Gammaproteobacteria bacterium]